MRRGRALLPHPNPLDTPDGRTLVSRHWVARCAKRHVNLVRRVVPAVACDVKTRVALVDLDEAEKILDGVPQRLRKRQPIVHSDGAIFDSCA